MTLTPAKRRKAREKKLKEFDVNKSKKIEQGLFGLPFEPDESEMVILPVPWDVCSLKFGASEGPGAILTESGKISLYHAQYTDLWKQGIAMHNIPSKWQESSKELRKITNKIRRNNLKKLSNSKQVEQVQLYKNINYTSLILKEWVENKCLEYLDQKKLLGLLGGDHSSALGFVKALSSKYKNFSILHVDAHPCLKQKPEGFDFSHDSFISNAIELEQVSKVVMLATREISYEEKDRLEGEKNKIRMFSDHYLKERLFRGTTLRMMVNEIISPLARNVYLTVDIDAFQPSLCPSASKKLPGGITFEEFTTLLTELKNSGKNIIGFDLCGVAPDSDKKAKWDEEIGARLLYELSLFLLSTK